MQISSVISFGLRFIQEFGLSIFGLTGTHLFWVSLGKIHCRSRVKRFSVTTNSVVGMTYACVLISSSCPARKMPMFKPKYHGKSSLTGYPLWDEEHSLHSLIAHLYTSDNPCKIHTQAVMQKRIRPTRYSFLHWLHLNVAAMDANSGC